MADKLKLGIVIGASLSPSLGSAVGSAKSKLDKLGSAIKTADASMGRLDAFRKAKTDLQSADAEFQRAKENLSRLQQEMRNTANPTKAMRDAVAKAHQEVHRANERLGKQRTALQGVRKEMAAAGETAAELERREKRVGAALEQLRAKRQKLSLAMDERQAVQDDRSRRRGELMDAVAIGATLQAPIRAAIRFESVMADVKKVVNFDTPQQFEQMRQDILRMSTEMPMASDQIGAIIAAAGQSGIARAELGAFAESAIKMGIAFDITGDQAGQMMANWRAGMRLSQNQVVGLADAVNYLSNNMNATAGAIGQVIQRQGAVAMSAGLTETQVASLSAALLSSGTSPEIAATALKNLTGALTKGPAATKAQQNAFDELGYSAEELAMLMQEDAAGTIKEVFKSIADAPKELQGSLVSQIFGEESKGAIMPLLANLDNLSQAFKLTTDRTKYAGSMQEEYAVRAATTENNLQLFQNRISRLGVVIGSVLLPPLNTLLGQMGHGIETVADLAQRFPGITKAVIGLAAALMAGKVVSIAFGYAWTFVRGAVVGGKVAIARLEAGAALANARMVAFNQTSLITAARTKALAVGGGIKAFGGQLIGMASSAIPTAIGGIRALTMALMTNPIGLVIGAIALGGALIYKYWEPLKAFFSGLWDGIVQGASPVMEALSPLEPAFRLVGDAISWVGSAIGDAIGWIGSLFEPVNSSSAALQEANQVGQSVGQTIGTLLVAPIRLAVGVFTALGEAIGWAVTKLTEIGQAIGFNPLGAIQAGWQATLDWLSGFSLADSGKAILDTLGEGIRNAKDGLVESVKGVFGKVRNLLPFSDAKEGPFSQLTASGSAILTTLGDGVKKAGPGAVKGPLSKALAGAATGLAVAMPAAAAASGAAPTPAAFEDVRQVEQGAGRSTPAITVHAPITIQASAGTNIDNLADELQHRLADIMRRAAIEAAGGENDEVI